jgi:GntR family transcriptional regulator / MocR family aminotransferase
MARSNRAGGILPLVSLEADSATPLYEQLYRELRRSILDLRLEPGTRLASSRTLAAELGVSRFTVVQALDQLAAEGYLKARPRGGMFVAASLPDPRMSVGSRRFTRPTAAPGTGPEGQTSPLPGLSARGRAVSEVIITGPRRSTGEPRAFRPRRPPLDVFPFTVWARLVRRQWRTFRHALLDYGEPAGYQPLRQEVARHLRATRGLECSADEVVITSGSQQAYDLLFRLLLDPGDQAWIEEPGYLDVRGALVAAGARVAPVPVDEQGLDVAAGARLAPTARLAYVSPSHQYPTGATLSPARRLALLAWARQSGAWIVEDDYDSYFRYRGRPLPTLRSLDPERVAYVGTFSKTMFPSLRLGYCVVPVRFVEAVANARAVADRNSSLVEQATLAAFLGEGLYDRHLRRIRTACIERHECLRHQVEQRLSGALTLEQAGAGTHVIARLSAPGTPEGSPRPSPAERLAKAAAEADLVVFPVSRYCLLATSGDAVVLGYGGLAPEQIAAAVERLARVVEALRS